MVILEEKGRTTDSQAGLGTEGCIQAEVLLENFNADGLWVVDLSI